MFVIVTLILYYYPGTLGNQNSRMATVSLNGQIVLISASWSFFYQMVSYNARRFLSIMPKPKTQQEADSDSLQHLFALGNHILLAKFLKDN